LLHAGHLYVPGRSADTHEWRHDAPPGRRGGGEVKGTSARPVPAHTLARAGAHAYSPMALRRLSTARLYVLFACSKPVCAVIKVENAVRTSSVAAWPTANLAFCRSYTPCACWTFCPARSRRSRASWTAKSAFCTSIVMLCCSLPCWSAYEATCPAACCTSALVWPPSYSG